MGLSTGAYNSVGGVLAWHVQSPGSPQHHLNQVWWCSPGVLALGNEGKEDQVSEVILSDRASLRPAKDTRACLGENDSKMR